MIYWTSALLSMKGYSGLLPVSLLKMQTLVMFINVMLKPQCVKRAHLWNAYAKMVWKRQNGMIVLVQVRTLLLYLSLKT